jgi:ATP-dependent RNA helicase SUPV3L1/SUV3
MLSITGMTLEQFADLMQGLGYDAQKGERAKAKPVKQDVPSVEVADASLASDDAPVAELATEETEKNADAPETEQTVARAETPVVEETTPAPDETAPEADETAPAADEGPEMEVFYTFTWGRSARSGAQKGRRAGDRPQGRGKPRKKHKRGDPHTNANKAGQKFSARPPKTEKKIDPDNPFAAALMGLKENK